MISSILALLQNSFNEEIFHSVSTFHKATCPQNKIGVLNLLHPVYSLFQGK